MRWPTPRGMLRKKQIIRAQSDGPISAAAIGEVTRMRWANGSHGEITKKTAESTQARAASIRKTLATDRAAAARSLLPSAADIAFTSPLDSPKSTWAMIAIRELRASQTPYRSTPKYLTVRGTEMSRVNVANPLFKTVDATVRTARTYRSFPRRPAFDPSRRSAGTRRSTNEAATSLSPPRPASQQASELGIAHASTEYGADRSTVVL